LLDSLLQENFIMSGDEDDLCSEEEQESKGKTFHVIKSYTDIQRLKLEKLMANPDKPVRIPSRPVDRDVNRAPEFNLNVMGSSAGAGSGEFHLYRQMRRKEQSRLKQLAYRKVRDELDAEFKQKLEENEKASAEKTAKKRLKRQKKKGKKKGKVSASVASDNKESEEDQDSDSSFNGECDKTELMKENVVVDPLMQDPPKKDPLVIYYN